MLAIAQFYLSAIVLMLPLLSCVGIGIFWGKRDLPFGGAFITTLVTSVTTPALVFHTFVTTRLDDRALADVAAAGYKSVIINRPDYEGGADQPTAAEVSKAAQALGLRIEYQPVVSGAMTMDDVVRFAELLRELPGPVLAYCRSGTRCTNLYANAQQIKG